MFSNPLPSRVLNKHVNIAMHNGLTGSFFWPHKFKRDFWGKVGQSQTIASLATPTSQVGMAQ